MDRPVKWSERRKYRSKAGQSAKLDHCHCVTPSTQDKQQQQQNSDSDVYGEAREGVAIKSEELEDETCGFCKFMKAGPCGELFAAWEKCVDASRFASRVVSSLARTCLLRTQA